MPSLTPNYSFNLPFVNSAIDADLWGALLNSNFSNLDTYLKDETELPVGSLYMNLTDGTNPATLLGYGTWTAITDMFIMARGSTYTGTGGAATVTLGTANLPPHSHTYDKLTVPGGSLVGSTGSIGQYTSTATSSVGSATPFSIIPVYQAVYTWYRSA